MESEGVHVVVVLYPLQGHINPLLQFAKRLTSKGVKATLATTPYTVPTIHAPGPVGLELISDGFDERGFEQASSTEAYLESFKTIGSRSLTDLLLKFKDSSWPVNCIVYDSLHPWALDVAHEMGICKASFMTTSASVCSLYCQVHKGALGLPLKPEALPMMLNGHPQLELGISDLPTFMVQSSDLAPFLSDLAPFLSVIMDNISRLEENDWVFLNTFEELENEAAKDMSDQCAVSMIGPMIPSFYLDQQIEGDTEYGASLWKPSSQAYLRWLDTKEPCSVIYASFGSMANLEVQQVEELAWGLQASKIPFLWVVRESEKHKLPNEFLSSMSDEARTGLVVTWCHQLEVLAHRSVGCFVSHCGWNSTIEALSLGVPVVGLDHWSDQPTNATVIEQVWKAGVRAKKNEKGIVAKEEIEMCVKQIMVGERGEEMKKNARKWREAAIRAVSKGGSSDMNIDKFIEALRKDKRN